MLQSIFRTWVWSLEHSRVLYGTGQVTDDDGAKTNTGRYTTDKMTDTEGMGSPAEHAWPWHQSQQVAPARGCLCDRQTDRQTAIQYVAKTVRH